VQSTRELFAEHNLRCTKQRMAVFESLRGCKSHPTADELLMLVSPRAGKISLATVYNSLEALCRAGLVRKIPTSNGSCRYDADTSMHTHVAFRDTNEIVDLPVELNREMQGHLCPALLERIGSALGIRIHGVSIQLMASRGVGDDSGESDNH
jgi:Fe2+ or Zn2+ uptake regulation protein